MVISDASARETVVDGLRRQQQLKEDNEDETLARKSAGAVRRQFLSTIVQFLRRWRERDRSCGATLMIADRHFASQAFPSSAAFDVLDDVSRSRGHRRIDGRRTVVWLP